MNVTQHKTKPLFAAMCAGVIALGALVSKASALTYQLPDDGSTLIGKSQTVQTIAGDTLTSLGRRYSMGIVELLEANPKLAIGKAYGPGQDVFIPSQFILPNVALKGIVVNLAELRLYFYVPDTREVRTFPVGIGRQGWDTPLGETYVARKIVDPTWYVPKTIKAERLKDGVTLPDYVGPGPDNPLGPYELRLGIPDPTSAYLIHGSNDPSGIGRRSSSGCIRMQPEAIESIFNLVPTNLIVTIVDEPVKVGWLNNDLYIEVHIPLDDDPENNVQTLIDDMHKLVNAEIANRPANVDWALADKVTKEQHGYPVKIGEGTGPIPQIAVPLNPQGVTATPQNQMHKRKKVAVKKHHKHDSWWNEI